MPILAKRLAVIVACAAVIGVDTAVLRTDLAGRALATLMPGHGDCTPAELGVRPGSTRQITSTREQRLDSLHPAIAASRAAAVSSARHERVGSDGLGAFDSARIHARGERGPPAHVRS